MTEAIFGLVGVVVGGVLSGVVNFVLDRRRESRACKSAARLAAGPLTKAFIELGRMLETGRWDVMVCDRVSLDRWRSSEDLFAATLDFMRWLDIYNAHRGVEQCLEVARDLDGSAISTEHADDIDRSVHKAIEGSVILHMIGQSGPQRRRLKRLGGRLWQRFRRSSDEDLIEQAQDRLEPQTQGLTEHKTRRPQQSGSAAARHATPPAPPARRTRHRLRAPPVRRDPSVDGPGRIGAMECGVRLLVIAPGPQRVQPRPAA